MTNTTRSPQNRLKNWTGTVHYADNGRVSCGSIATGDGWLVPSVATVNCKRCVAQFGADEPNHVDPAVTYFADDHAARRAAEREARKAARS